MLGIPVTTRPTSLNSVAATLEHSVLARDDSDSLTPDDVTRLKGALRTVTSTSSDLCMRCYARQLTMIQQALRTHSLRRYLATFSVLATAARATAAARD